MPSRTWSTSAPTDSHSVATALMKLIFIARNALDAYLISSALLAVVAIKDRWLTLGFRARELHPVADNNCHPPAAHRSGADAPLQAALSVPITMRSG